MGNTRSEFFEPVSVDLWWNNDQASTTEPELVQINQQRINKANEDKMEEIKQEISSLHDKRLRLIAEKKKEMDGLRQELARHKKQNEELKDFIVEKGYEPPIQEWDTTKVDVSLQTETFEVPGGSNLEEDDQELGKIKGKNLELQINIAELQKELQSANSELAAFETERKEYKTHVTALKDIITVSKQLLLMRENQIKELTQKVTEIQESLAAKELQAFSEDLRQEYARQLQNIKQLRVLYEERQRADKTERENLKSQLEEAQTSLKSQETKNTELQERVDELEKDNSNKYDNLISLESQLGLTKAECSELRSEMSVINQLFSQILMGFNNRQEIDMDKLIKTLEENHGLLTEIVINEESNESSALPKVLLDLVTQVNDKTKLNPQEETNSDQGLALETIAEESESQGSTQQNSLSSASEIVQNLPKVWKILTELLSHQTAPISVLNVENEHGDTDTNPCYKSVETPAGPTMVLSVSKTFIRLKNLIVEKKSLEKETTRLKQLNTHLETRLQDQEKRLEMVSHELSKTWHVVGKMQKQHQQLHTQEKILRYELAQKRKLLNELKEELEYCREKWMQAREKNSTTEEQWKQLRNEFAARKNTVSEDLNNSVESGYSDERESSSSDDDIEEDAGVSPEAESEVVGESSEGNNQTILKVVKEEIAKIEGSEAGSSSQVLEDVPMEPQELGLNDNSSNNNETEENEQEDVENCHSTSSDCVLSSEIEISAPLDSNIDSTVEESCEVSSPTTEEILEDVSPSSSPDIVDVILTPLSIMVEMEEEGTTSLSSAIVDEILTPSSLEEATSLASAIVDEILTSSSLEEHMVREATSSVSAMVDEDVPSSSLAMTDDQVLSSEEPIMSRSIENIEEEHASTPCEASSVKIGDDQVLSSEERIMSRSIENIEEEHGSIPCEASSAKIEDVVPNKNEEEANLMETLKTDPVQNQEVQIDASEAPKTHEERLAAREERLQRLEEQAKDLITQRTNTSNRSVEICTKLDNLHEQYGGDQKTRRKDIDDMYKKLEEDILQTIKKTQSGEEYPSTSRQTKNTEEMLAAREERLKRLEEQSNVLVNQAAKTSSTSKEISSNLDKNQEEPEEEPEASTSSSRTPEEILARREERLQQMEEQAQQLVSKARRNSLRNVQFWRKLNKLHDRYGESCDSSDDSADDNNNNNADGIVEAHNEERVGDVNNEAQLDLEEAENAPEEGEEE